MNRSVVPQQILNLSGGGGISNFIPRNTNIMGQPHYLAYINSKEGQLLKDLGGAGLPGPGGVPAYWELFKPSTWGDGKGYQGSGLNSGGGGSSSSSSSSSSGSSSSNRDDADFDPMEDIGVTPSTTSTAYNSSGGNNNNSNQNTASNYGNSVGVLDSLLMGLGLKDPTSEYIATTARTIANDPNMGEGNAVKYIAGFNDSQQAKTLADTIVEDLGLSIEEWEQITGLNVDVMEERFDPETGDYTGPITDVIVNQPGDYGMGGDAPTEPEIITNTPTPTPPVTTTPTVEESQQTLQDFQQQIATNLSNYMPDEYRDDPGSNPLLKEDKFKLDIGTGYNFRPTTQQLASILRIPEAEAQKYLDPEGLTFDFRNWEKILGSEDPLQATEDSLYALYLTPELFGPSGTGAFSTQKPYEDYNLESAQQNYLYTIDPTINPNYETPLSLTDMVSGSSQPVAQPTVEEQYLQKVDPVRSGVPNYGGTRPVDLLPPIVPSGYDNSYDSSLTPITPTRDDGIVSLTRDPYYIDYRYG